MFSSSHFSVDDDDDPSNYQTIRGLLRFICKDNLVKKVFVFIIYVWVGLPTFLLTTDCKIIIGK